MNDDQIREVTEIGLSWLRAFLAAGLAYILNGLQTNQMLTISGFFTVGLVACLPPAIRYFDRNDSAFGRNAGDE